MRKAAVAIDSWKLEVFEKHLKRDGFEYEQHPGVTPDTLTLSVETDDVWVLHATVKRASDECALLKGAPA